MRFPKIPALLLLSLLAALASRAVEFRYFAGNASAIFSKLPPPPDDDSPAGMADVQTLLQVQRDRTPEQAARAAKIAAHTPLQMGEDLFGGDFAPDKLPRTNALLDRVNRERRAISLEGKRLWNRVRPWQRGLGVEPCVELPIGSSYPSGHSCAGAAFAAVWGEILPEYRPFFEARVAETMWARVLGGVHYPTDTQAGRLMGRLIAAEMLKNPATLESIREARAEVMAFLETRPALVARAKFLTAACPPVPAAPPRDSLLVMSFNIRLKTPKDTGTRDWKARRGGVVEIARRHYPDLIGFQEALPEQVRFLSKELPEYACVAAGREGGGLGEAVPVFYKTRRFEALGSGHFWLSETPDVPGSKTPEWGARYPRMVTWARLRDKVTGRELCFASTHFSHVSDDARVHAARVVAERLGKAGDVSVILAGDFNAPSEPGVPPYDTLRDAGFLDTWTLAAARENAECGSFNGYGLKAPKTGAAPVRIDWILAKPAKGAALSVAKAAVLTERPGGVFASDHFPVAVRLSLE